MTTDLTTREYWQKAHADIAWPRLVDSYADRETYRVFLPLMREKDGGSILELGCGDSYWLPFWGSSRVMQVAGLDYVASRVETAKQNLRAIGVDSDLRCADIKDLQTAWTGKFDVVYSRGVMEHFSDPVPILKTCSQYLAKDGLFVTTVPHLKGMWGCLDKTLARFKEWPYQRWDLADLKRIHEQAGLTVVSSSYFRLLDPSILNFSRTPRRFQWAMSHLFSFMGKVRKWEPKCPSALYTDMIVVAKR